MKTISAIVPVYNVKDFVGKCIESILNQSYKNLEIILVDDGSTDNSGEICDEYAAKDNRIKVIHKENGGLSSARNAGLDVATGDYIGFVDSDDYIHPDMYATLLYAIEKENADIAMGYIKLTDSHECNFDILDKDNYEIKNREEYWYMSYQTDGTAAQMTMCPNKLFRRSVIGALRFHNGRYHEDVFLLSDYITSLNKAVIYKDFMYFYYQRSESIIHTINYKNLSDGFDSIIYKLSVADKEFPDIFDFVCINFKERWFVYLYRINQLETSKHLDFKKYILKRANKDIKLMKKVFIPEQIFTLKILRFLPLSFFMKLIDYDLNIFLFVKKHLKHQK